MISRCTSDALSWAPSTVRCAPAPDLARLPAFGHSYQAPFADRIRNETRIATIVVGAISSYDDVNSIILAGRADLCARGRAGSPTPQLGRTDGPRPRLTLIREGAPAAQHRRWHPVPAPQDAGR